MISCAVFGERFDKNQGLPYNRHTVSEERIYYVYLQIITG